MLHIESLADIIAAEADVVSAFVSLLQDEQQLLTDGHADALTDLVDRKTVVIARLAPISAKRNATLASAGLPADLAGMTAWRERHPHDARCLSAWERLQKLAEEARELNRVNGELIQIHLRNNTQVLEALLAASGRQDLYSASGMAAGSTGQRIIDSA